MVASGRLEECLQMESYFAVVEDVEFVSRVERREPEAEETESGRVNVSKFIEVIERALEPFVEARVEVARAIRRWREEECGERW